MDCSIPGFPVLHLPEFTQIHVHWVDEVIQPSHLLPYFLPQDKSTAMCIFNSFPSSGSCNMFYFFLPSRRRVSLKPESLRISVMKWQLTPIFLPGKSNSQRSLVGYSPLGCKSQTWLSDWTTTTKNTISYWPCQGLRQCGNHPTTRLHGTGAWEPRWPWGLVLFQQHDSLCLFPRLHNFMICPFLHTFLLFWLKTYLCLLHSELWERRSDWHGLSISSSWPNCWVSPFHSLLVGLHVGQMWKSWLSLAQPAVTKVEFWYSNAHCLLIWNELYKTKKTKQVRVMTSIEIVGWEA